MLNNKIKSIREELKEKLGVTSRQVSVSKASFGYSDAVNVIIKDASVDIDKVRDIAEKYLEVRRDYFGEILEGCNCYVFVYYDYRLLLKLGEKYGDFLKDIKEKAITTHCVQRVCDGILVDGDERRRFNPVKWFKDEKIRDDEMKIFNEISETYVLVRLERESMKKGCDVSDSKGNYQGDSF
jgi:hypothetical protein